MAYRAHNVVERLLNRLELRRRDATRSEKWAANSQAMVSLACIMRWL
jgi:hypothetical protein